MNQSFILMFRSSLQHTELYRSQIWVCGEPVITVHSHSVLVGLIKSSELVAGYGDAQL